MPDAQRAYYTGIGFAVLATVIWSGNYVIARSASTQIPPVSLAFYRWLIATILIAPFAIKQFRAEKKIVQQNLKYIFWVALIGVSLFNTLVYVAGHHTSAINMALIGTTSAPIFASIMAAFFLKETMGAARIAGLLVCMAGIVLLLSRGSLEHLLSFRFSTGDLWMLAAGFSFAVYTVLVRKKPSGLSALNFLFVIFLGGTLILLPGYLIERQYATPIRWNTSLLIAVVYLGLGASFIAYLFWNIALQKLGAGRTVLFANLIPLFSTLEAVLFLQEKVTVIHLLSGMLVIIGLLIANSRKRN